MIQYLFIDTSKLLNIGDITKKNRQLFKLCRFNFYGVPYPELALTGVSPERAPDSGKRIVRGNGVCREENRKEAKDKSLAPRTEI